MKLIDEELMFIMRLVMTEWGKKTQAGDKDGAEEAYKIHEKLFDEFERRILGKGSKGEVTNFESVLRKHGYKPIDNNTWHFTGPVYTYIASFDWSDYLGRVCHVAREGQESDTTTFCDTKNLDDWLSLNHRGAR